MNRLISALLIYLVPLSPSASAAAPAPAPLQAQAQTLEPVQVSKRVWYFEGASGMAARANQGFMSNAGFVVTDDSVLIFDALATPELAKRMLASIRKITDLPIAIVVVSHYHADHIYGLQVFKEAGAEIWARKEGKNYLGSPEADERLEQRRRDLSPWVDQDTQLIAADRWLCLGSGEKMPFDLGGMKFQLLSGGDSHYPGDLMLYIEDQAVLFAGDLFFTGRIPFVVGGNTREWLSALSLLASTAAKIVIPGHGQASHQVQADLGMTRDYLNYLRSELTAAVSRLDAFDEAYEAIDWQAFENLPTFSQVNRRNAYSVYLALQAESLDDDGRAAAEDGP